MKWLSRLKCLFGSKTETILHNNIDRLYLSDFMAAMEIQNHYRRPTLVLSGEPTAAEYSRAWQNVLYDWSIRSKPVMDAYIAARNRSDMPELELIYLDIKAFENTGYLPARWFQIQMQVCQKGSPDSINHDTTTAELIETLMRIFAPNNKHNHL